MNRPSTDSYAFSNRAAEADQQLSALESYLDPVTTGVLDRTGIPAGARCLEIGPGGGSIVDWLAARTGPAGRVVAVDLDPSKLRPAGSTAAGSASAGSTSAGRVEVHEHDIREGLPDPGPFDLIHARLVLLHLPQRRWLLRQLVDALAPGGWLVVGEFSSHPLAVVTTPEPADAALFTRVIEALARVLADHGADLDWAYQLHPAMLAAGLQRVHTVEYAESWTGGGAGARLHEANSRQKQAELVAAGVTEDELERFQRLMDDPRFCARGWQFVCTRGRRPAP